jgi:hypothetical protein
MGPFVTSSTIDPQFPQIPKILQPNYMLEVLQNSVFRNKGIGLPAIKLESCSIGEKRYKPGKSFRLSYLLGLQNLATDTRHEQLLTAQLCPTGRGYSGFESDLDKQTLLPLGIPSVSYIPDVDMVLWAFPHDRKLPYLPKLLDSEFLNCYVPAHLISLGLSTSEHISSVQTKVMHYLPECSCMIRYTLAVADKSKGNEFREIAIYGKNYCVDNGLEAYAIMQQLAKQIGHCAKPLTYDPGTKTLWQSHLPGKPFEWEPTLVNNHELISKVAVCIAGFHNCTLETAGRYGFVNINKQLEATCKIASAADSVLAEQVKSAVQKILTNYEQMDWHNTAITPIHLDLKMGNLLVSDDSVSLIDMDCVCLGDPLADVGSFVANLYLNGLRVGSNVLEIDKVVTQFCTEYCAAVDWGVDHNKLNWYISAALIHEVVRRSLRQQNKERLQQVSSVIELSNRYGALCRSRIGGN